VATDARRREVFWARYDAAGSRIDGPHVDRPADVTPELGPDVAVVGPGAVLLGAEADDREIPIARLASLVDLSADPVPLTPTYLRRPDATEPVR
jgi:tRNA A37 threonylcarbamoyladenosine modification protein TsaB